MNFHKFPSYLRCFFAGPSSFSDDLLRLCDVGFFGTSGCGDGTMNDTSIYAIDDKLFIVQSTVLIEFDFFGVDVMVGLNFFQVVSKEVQNIRVQLIWSDLSFAVIISMIDELFG